MIDELRAIAIFAETVKQQSFRGAAKSLDLSPSVVSYQVSQLEEKLGVALLYRSTRSLSLTHEGEILYQHAINSLASVSAGLDEVSKGANTLRGQISITVSTALIGSSLVTKIGEFCSNHPQVTVQVDFSDERQNIIAAGYDLAIRAGELQSSELKSKRLGNIERALVCSPAYIESQNTVDSIEELQQWNWVQLEMLPPHRDLISTEGKELRLSFNSNCVVNSVQAMAFLCESGVGLATPPRYLVQHQLSSGSLIELFPTWKVKPIPLYASWPNNVMQGSVTRSLLNYLT